MYNNDTIDKTIHHKKHKSRQTSRAPADVSLTSACVKINSALTYLRYKDSKQRFLIILLLNIIAKMTETAAAPVKAKKAAAKPKKPAAHPKYSEMIAAAVGALKERSGSSRQAILKYIQANYKVGSNQTSVNAHLKMALKAGVKSGAIKQAKGTGASGSFKLGEVKKAAKKATKPKAAKPKKATKKPAAKKAAKKPAAKKAKTPKKEKKAAKPKKAKTPKKAAAKPKKAASKSPKKAKAAKPKKAKTPKKAAAKK